MADTFVTKAKVAGLVSDGQVSFNAGKNKGVQEGDVITLYKSVDVIDPDTKERLGGVEIGRLKMRVFLVAAKYSVGTVTDRVPSSDIWATIASVQVPRTKTVTLDASEESSSVVLVKIGESASIRRPEPDTDSSQT